MEQKTINSQNVKIAEFMDEKGEFERKQHRAGTIESLHYHDEWDWIMPVIDKIDKMGATVTIGRMYCEIKFQDPLKHHLKFDNKMVCGIKIRAIHATVVNFIIWYNSNYNLNGTAQ